MVGPTSAGREFLELLGPLEDSLYRTARRTAWRADLAGDIVQEAVMTAWREFDRFQRGTNFRAWMFRILLHSTYRINKRVGRQREVHLDESNVEWTAVLEREEVWGSLLDDPERLRQLLDQRLAGALDGLGQNERQCLLLRVLEGFSYREIGEMMQIPVGTVMSHVYRARMNLRERLAALAAEQGLLKESRQ